MESLLPRVTIGIGHRYDSLYLRNGVVRVEGFEVAYPSPPEKSKPQAAVKGYVAPSSIFTAVATKAVYDVGELALSTYFQAVEYGKEITAIPVFPSRFFPHSQIAVHSDAAIHEPKDLARKRFGVGFFSKNYAVWLRGILREQYNVPGEDLVWIEDEREHFSQYRPPARFTVDKAPEGETLGSLLESGNIDALTAPRAPQRSKSSKVRALFEDPYAEIGRYFQRYSLFPINTVLTIPKAAHEKHPNLAGAVFAAFEKALELYREEIRKGSRDDEHGGLSLHRLEDEAGVRLPGYGFKANRENLRTMLRYCHEQGIIQKRYRPEDIFLLTET